MSLSDKQYEFAKTMARFEVWIGERWKYVRGEAHRSPQEAERLAKFGKVVMTDDR